MMWASFAEGIFVGASLAAVVQPIGKRLPKRKNYQPTAEPEEPRMHNAAVEATAEAVAEFAVTGKPKKVPFRLRKQELREAARTKRRKLEEWRD